MPDTNVVELKGLQKLFGKFQALHDIDLSVRKGEVLTLLGPSGCGKSTLMRIVAGFEKATFGDVIINGDRVNDTPPEKRPVNMVFQRYALFPHLDVFDNVAFGLRLKKRSKQDVTEATQRILDLVQLSDLSDRWIGEISGGQAQRVALARALVNEPTVLLLDEPLAALDLKIRHYMIGELKRIHETTGTTFLYVTHDQDEAMMLSDRIVLMNEGRIEQIGTPEEMYSAPKTLFTARFLGETNIIPATFVSRDGAASVYDTPIGPVMCDREMSSSDDCNILSVRPEALSIGSDLSRLGKSNTFEGKVEEMMFIGSRILYTVRVNEEVSLRCQEHRPAVGDHFKTGDTVTLHWDSSAVVALSNGA